MYVGKDRGGREHGIGRRLIIPLWLNVCCGKSRHEKMPAAAFRILYKIVQQWINTAIAFFLCMCECCSSGKMH